MRRHNPNNRTNRRQYREIARIENFTMHCKHENLAKSGNFAKSGNLNDDLLICTTNENGRRLSTNNISAIVDNIATTDNNVFE